MNVFNAGSFVIWKNLSNDCWTPGLCWCET